MAAWVEVLPVFVVLAITVIATEVHRRRNDDDDSHHTPNRVPGHWKQTPPALTGGFLHGPDKP